LIACLGCASFLSHDDDVKLIGKNEKEIEKKKRGRCVVVGE